jgi:large repetitive protein
MSPVHKTTITSPRRFALFFSQHRQSPAKMFALSFLFFSGLLHAGEATRDSPPIVARGEVVQEGNSGTRPLLFRIGLAPFAIAQTVTLAYSTQDDTATAGEDYQSAQGTVTLSPTATFAEIPVLVNGDTEVESFENLRLVIRDPAAAPTAPPVAVAIGGIDNDDATPPPPGVTFSVRGEGVREGNSGTTPLRFTVTRTNPQATNAVLNLQFSTVSDTATAGSDFEAASGEITLQPTQASATVTVNVIGDSTVENVEFLRLEVSDPILAIPPQIGLGAIFDDDGTQPQVTVAIPLDALAAEPATGESEARLAVRLASPATEALRFTFAASPGATATAGVDFIGPSSGELVFAVGDLVKDIPFRILADNLIEGREIVAYTITPPQGVVLQRNFVTLSIIDRPTVQPPASVSAFIVPCRPFVGERDGNARLLVKRVGDTSGALSINFATQDGTALAGSDYTNTFGVLNWVAGNAEFKRVDVPIINDQIVETPERFVVRLTDASGQPFPGRSIAPIVILDGADQLSLQGFEELCTSAPDTSGQEY